MSFTCSISDVWLGEMVIENEPTALAAGPVGVAISSTLPVASAICSRHESLQRLSPRRAIDVIGVTQNDPGNLL